MPEDVAVGGFDDSQSRPPRTPPLTTIRQPLERVAAKMVELALRHIDKQTVESVLVPTELVRRESA